MCPHTTIYLAGCIAVLYIYQDILQNMCPHTTIYMAGCIEVLYMYQDILQQYVHVEAVI
jgi:hypothetical protein